MGRFCWANGTDSGRCCFTPDTALVLPFPLFCCQQSQNTCWGQQTTELDAQKPGILLAERLLAAPFPVSESLYKFISLHCEVYCRGYLSAPFSPPPGWSLSQSEQYHTAVHSHVHNVGQGEEVDSPECKGSTVWSYLFFQPTQGVSLPCSCLQDTSLSLSNGNPCYTILLAKSMWGWSSLKLRQQIRNAKNSLPSLLWETAFNQFMYWKQTWKEKLSSAFSCQSEN